MTIETKKARFTKEELATEFEIGNLEERFNNAKKLVRYRLNSKGTKCWSVYGVYDNRQVKVNGIIKSTAKTGWHNAPAKVANDMLTQQCGITLVDFVNIEEFMNNREQTTNENPAVIEQATATIEETDGSEDDADEETFVAVEGETVDTQIVKPADDFMTKLAELKAKAHAIRKEFDASLRDRYVNFNGKFFNTDDALDFTTFANDKYDWLYRKDDNGEYVKVSEEEFNAINRIECRLESVQDAIKAEIAKNTVKFEVGKWYSSDEYVADGEEPYKYLILKRTAKTVTIYDPEQDGWGYLEDYDHDDEIDGEFDCISRKKIQYDERGEYVDWKDEDGELVQVFAKDKTEKPTNDDDNNDAEAPELSEELIDEYVVSDEAQTQALRAELYNVAPADDFMIKLNDLSAAVAIANAEDRKARDAEVEAYNAWQAAKQKVEETADKYRAAINAFKTFGCEKAKELRDTLLENDIKLFSDAKIIIVNQKGEEIASPDLSQIFITFYNGVFQVSASWDNFATYDTPAEVTDVIARLKAAIARGDNQFSFAPDDETINQPDNTTPDKLRDSLARAMEECLLKMQEHCRKLDINAACYERELYNICSQGLRGASKIA